LLVRLQAANKTFAFSKTDLNDTAKALKRTAVKLRALSSWGEARNLGLHGDAANWLIGEASRLEKLAGQIHDKAVTAHKGHHARLGRAKARLVHYVKQTGEYHDDAAAVLIDVVTGKQGTYTAEAHRKWRERHMERYADDLKGPAGHTEQ
jgi:hypothetical protein